LTVGSGSTATTRREADEFGQIAGPDRKSSTGYRRIEGPLVMWYMWYILNAIGMELRNIYRELSAVAAFIARYVPVIPGE
jgi:hypothetical protein